MKNTISLRLLTAFVFGCCMLACKKSTPNNFSATVGNQALAFDSLFAWVDTSSASAGFYWLDIGAKDTKTSNLIYIASMLSPSSNISGTYFYNGPQNPQLPAAFRWLLTSTITVSSGVNKGVFQLTGPNTSKLIIDRYTASEVGGSFSIDLNPTLPDGTIDLSTKISASGQFSLPYRVLP
jgi:hypothetical protein